LEIARIFITILCSNAGAGTDISVPAMFRLLVFGSFLPPGLLESLAEQVLDMPVQAPQFIVGPALKQLQYFGIDPYEKRLLLCHDY